MTVSNTSTYNPDIGTLFLAAHELCGIVNEHQALSEAQVGRSRRQLDLLIDHLQAEGVAARTRLFTTIVLVSGQRDYTLEATVLDVEGGAAFIPAGQVVTAASGETPLQPMPLHEWQELSAKNATGRPFRYYPNRNGEQIVVSLWPTPDAASADASVRFVAHRLRADSNDANATADFEPYWRQYLVFMLGSRLARSYSLHDVAANLAAEARPMLEKCRAAAAPQDTTDFVLGHGVGYR